MSVFRAFVFAVLPPHASTKLQVVLIFLLLFFDLVTNDDGGYNDPKKSFWRLPSFITPLLYNITIEPNVNAGTFSGYMEMTFTFSAASGQVPLNLVRSTTITSASLVNSTGNEITGSWNRRRETYDLQIIDFSVKIPATKGGETLLLKLGFAGPLSSDIRGIYRSSFKDGALTRQLVGTNLLPTDARYVFPCVDDPGRKAQVQLNVVVPTDPDVTVLSNTVLESQVAIPATVNGTVARTKFVFTKTPVMSTYSVAFAVLPKYTSIFRTFSTKLSSTGAKPFTVSVWTRPGQSAFAQFALDTTIKALDALEGALQMPFPTELGKLDIVAIPDFAPGATENWGLIITRETALLVDSEMYPSTQACQAVASTIVRKVAQQWFGNSATPDWWNSIWLSEGMATFWEYAVMDTMYPAWGYTRNFIAQEQQKSMALDALDSVRPIVYNVSSPSEIAELFYPITSSKSANVLRMLATLVDPTGQNPISLYNSFRSYLTDFTKTVTVTNDNFWTKLTNTLTYPTSDLFNMRTLAAVNSQWFTSAGFPLVTVVAKPSGGVEFTQSRFLLSGTEVPSVIGVVVNASAPVAAPAAQVQQRWWIPITYRIDGTTVASTHLNAEKPSTTINLSPSSYVKLNLNNTGYFRVRYPPAMFSSIVNAMRGELGIRRILRTYSDSDRAGFLNDALVLSSANYPTPLLEYPLTFDALTMLRSEDGYAAWAGALEGLNQLADLLQDQSCFGNFAYFMTSLIQPVLDRVNFGPVEKQLSSDWSSCTAANLTAADMVEDIDTEMLRSALLQVAVEFDYEASASKLRILWNCTQNNPSFILPGSLQPAVFSAQAATGDLHAWTSVLTRYRSAQNAQERLRLLRALAQAKRPHLLNTLLQLTLNSSEIRPQDRAIAIAAVAANPYGGRQIAWDFVRQNWQTLSRASTGVGSIITAATSHFSNEFYLREVDNFFSSPSARSAVDNAKDLIRRNTAWVGRYSSTVCDYLAKTYP